MTRAKTLLRLFFADERGATAIEYALIALLVAIPTVGAFTLLGGRVRDSFLAAAAGLV
jgi:pilus assembly protein Flp/PilA